jgi:hypothetical protein
MTPKERAKELHEKMFANCRIAMAGAYLIFHGLAKKLAIIAVDEILPIYENMHKPEYASFDINEPYTPK